MISWCACYKNGDRISQGPGITYDKLARHGLEAFIILFNSKPIITLHLDENKKLIWRKRTEMTFGDPNPVICHLFGYRENINGKNTQSILYVFEQKDKQGNDVYPDIHLSGEFDRIKNRFFYPPQYREFEKVGDESGTSNK